MILILILILTFLVIHFQLSIIELLPLIISITVFFFSNLLLGFNPFSLKLHIIRIFSILLILYFSYKNSSIYSLSLLTPFCRDEIHFVHDFDVKSLNYYKMNGSVFYLKNLTLDITNFLDNLNETDNYWANLTFHPDILGYNIDDGIKLFISDPILINKDSSPLLLTQFIMNRLNIMIDLYYLDDSIINSKDSIIVVKFTEPSSNNQSQFSSNHLEDTMNLFD
jgi:hypothetical protein